MIVASGQAAPAAASIGAKLWPTVAWISTTLADPTSACRRASCIAAAEFTFPLCPELKLSMPATPHQRHNPSARLPQNLGPIPVGLGHSMLELDGCAERIHRARELRQSAIAGELDQPPA